MGTRLNSFRGIRDDFPAGMVVFLVALPLCLGIGLASTGRPDLVFAGVISGIIGGLVVGFLSGSHVGVSGPAAGLVVIVLTATEKLGSFEALLLATFLAGIIQLLAGFLKAGIIAYYFPSSVIKGMLAAIGLTLILKEIPHALGYDADFFGDFAMRQQDDQNTFSGLYFALTHVKPAAFMISAVSLAILLILEQPLMKKYRLFKSLPPALFVVVAGIVLNFIFMKIRPEWALAGDHIVQLPVAESASEFVNFFSLPDFTVLQNPQVYIVAATIALVASLETLLCVEATDKLDPYKRATPTNRELKAQGVGNMIAGLIGGLPITQVIVRSSANINAGAKTKRSAIIHGAILLLSACVLPRILNLIPLASLAAILLVVGYKLSRLSLYRNMFRLGYEQFIPFAGTIIGILLTDLLKGIVMGIAIAIFFILRKNYKHSYHFRKEKSPEAETVTLRLSEEVTFLNKASIRERLDSMPSATRVIIDGSHSVHIDHDVLEIIHNFRANTAPQRNIQVETIGIREAAAMNGH